MSLERPITRVGRYRILSELGRGGMSNVYLAVAQGPGGVNKLVVLKALLPDLSSEPYALAMFLDEARLAAQLNHPNVVQTYEVGTEGDRHVIVMEYLEGQSLSATLKRARGPLPLGLHLRIIVSTLEGLHYAHELRAYDGTPLLLVHRDVSPQNVFVTYDGQVKVLDFGIAKATSSSTHTATGVVKGKIAYMSPEQIIADQVDRRADLYSVGCMLWAAAAGHKLWKDTPDVHIMRRVINGEIPTPQSANPGCDDELNRIVMKALATNADARYQTALEFEQDLEAYCEQLGPVVRQKELARFVSELFADTRAELHVLVERQLTLIQSDDSSSSREYTPAPRGAATTPTGAGPSLVPTKIAGNPRAKRSGKGTLALVAFVLLGLGGLLWYRLPGAVREPVAAGAPGVPTLAAPRPAAAARVSMTLRATPAEATLFVDGQALPANPTTKLFPADGNAHVLRAEAPGFSAATAEFSPTQDATVELALIPVTAAANDARPNAPGASQHRSRRALPLKPTASATPTKPTATATPAPAKPDCDSPFFLDKDGIRRVRPECR